MSAAVSIDYHRNITHQKNRPMNFLEQLKLQALRRYQEENDLYNVLLNEHVGALETMVANSNDGIAMVAGDNILASKSKIQYVNPAFSQMTGYSAEEIIGLPANVLRQISGQAGQSEGADSSSTNSAPFTAEVECSSKSNEKFWAEVTLCPLRDQDRKVSRWLYILHDVDDRHRLKSIEDELQTVQVENAQLVVERERQKAIEADLARNAFHDSLTGLRNRQYFLDRLADSLERARTRSSYRAAVVYLDLDGFKAINDNLGHRGGDQVLIETSRRLEKCCRTQDTVARLGGDEFAILIDNIDSETGTFITQRILDTLTPLFRLGDDIVSISPSLGYCAVQPSYANAEDIVRDADIAMYRAKRKGGATCVFFDDSINESATAAALQKRELSQAIQEDQFELLYQPLLDMLTTPPKLWGVEALVRWRHPDRGLLLPAQFLPLADKTGLAVPLGLWILRTACKQLKQWQSCVLHPEFMLCVNISAAQINDPQFLQDFVDVLADTEIDARSLQLEVAEEVFLQKGLPGVKTLESLRNLGVQIAIDKFGSGSCSLGKLEDYPVDVLKLDGSFVKRLIGSPREAILPRMIIEYALTLGLTMTAEEVENQAQINALRELDCTLVQGNIFSSPVEEKAIASLLDRGTRSLEH
jgi:diguanylate cyclase (GGDEF)-like protein/PAS domain S-box-containing protein